LEVQGVPQTRKGVDQPVERLRRKEMFLSPQEFKILTDKCKFVFFLSFFYFIF
jgi:hypothetical protein